MNYTIRQRLDGLWTAYDADGQEVDGIAHECRENAENFVRAMEAWRGQDVGAAYIHMTPRED